jgi:putative oxidoreductase
VAEEKQMKKTFVSDPHLSPPPEGEADAQRPVRGVWNIAWRIADFIVAGVFIYAGAIKILDPVQFANDVDNYKILPWTIGVGLAFYLPWLEMFCGLALLFRFLYRGALSILLTLIGIFILATIAAKVRGLDITCGCFGHASQHWSFPGHMAVDLVLLASVLLLFWAGSANRLKQDALEI